MAKLFALWFSIS